MYGLSKISYIFTISLMVFYFISPDIKHAAIRIYKNNLMDLDNILDCLDMSESTFFHALWWYQETGDIEPPKSTTHGRPWKLHFNNLTYMTALINHHPDWFLDELLGLLDMNWFISVHFTTIYWELECAGVSLKKLRWIAKEHDEDLRADFIRTMGQYQPEEIGFLNEFSKDECMLHQCCGWAKKGKCAVMRGAFVHGCRVSAEGLLSLDGIIASTVVEGSMMCEKFLYFLEHSRVSSVSTPCCDKPLNPLIDASYITISGEVEWAGDGQHTHPPWVWNFGACQEIWYTYCYTWGCFWHWFFLQVFASFSCPHTLQI